MNALDFANSIRGGSFKFVVVGGAEAVKKLRDLADRIEAQKVPRLALINAYSSEAAPIEDFSITTLVLEFAEIAASASPNAKLYDGNHQFPVEVGPKPKPDAHLGAVEK